MKAMTGPATRGLGYVSHCGSLDTAGMLFANGSSWPHVLRAAAELNEVDDSEYLTDQEEAALDGRCNPSEVA